MKDQKFPPPSQERGPLSPTTLFLSFFGVGFIPFAPGTFGSAATLPLLYLLGKYEVPVLFLVPITLILIIGTCFMTEFYQRAHQVHDPSWIVIDEVLGMLVTWFFWPSSRFLDLFLTFLFFRIFDIFKIWPATFFDKKVKHGAGTILDDIVSGLYAGALHLILQKFLIQH